MEHIGTYLNKRGSLSPREVEIGILVIARHWDADYVRQAHIREGKRVGLSQETIDALVAGTDPKLTDPHERGVYEFANALANGAKLPMQNLRTSKRSWAETASRRCWFSLATTHRWRSP